MSHDEHHRRAERMEAVARLARGMANDLNNMLAVILNYADFAKERTARDPKTREYLEAIRRAALRSTTMTRQLLMFGGGEVGAAQVIDPNASLLELEPVLASHLGPGCELALSLSPEARNVRIAPQHLQQALTQLATNAKEAMPLGGRLLLRTSNVDVSEGATEWPELAPGRYVCVTVEDTGVGMPADVARYVFEPFFTTKEDGPNRGIGLAVVYGIVAAAGGTVRVESSPGEGATFRLLLPATDAAIEARLGGAKGPAPRGRGERVLVVEDEPAVRQLTVQILEEHGYRVRWLEAPEAALDLCTRVDDPVDLLLTDVVMPRMSGTDLAAYVRALRPNLRVLFMSGHTDGRIARNQTWDKSAGFLQKPFDSEQLLRAVREVLDALGTP